MRLLLLAANGLLRLYPADFRRRYSAEILDGLEENRSAAGLVNLAWGVFAERFDQVAQDVRVAVRSFAREPGFVAVATLAMALGIGANTAIFSVVNAAILRPLPFQNPDELVWLTQEWPERNSKFVAGHSYLDWRDQSKTIQSIEAYRGLQGVALLGGKAEVVQVGEMSARMPALLGVAAEAGRLFTSEEDAPGGRPVVALSQGFWRTRFGSDPGVIGSSITLDERAHEIVGVFPDSLHRVVGADIWRPIAVDAVKERGKGPWKFIGIVGRVRPGVSIETLTSELDLISSRAEGTPYWPLIKGARAVALPLHDYLSGNVRVALLVLWGAVTLVLLIASANLANLLLARAGSRRRETAVRLAIGAGRGRLIRQLLTESTLLSLLGAVAGLGLAAVALRAMLALLPQSFPATSEIGLDAEALMFTLGTAVVCGLLFGLAPVFSAPSSAPFAALKNGSRTQLQGPSASR